MTIVEDALRFVTARMQVDAEWAVQEETSLTWWPSSLKQRVWASPAREVQGVSIQTLHVETDLLADVPMEQATWDRLAAVNRFAALSAYVADVPARAVRLHASVSMTPDNLPMARMLALHAMALQAADAYAEAAELADAFGARVAASAHPRSGARPRPDEMLDIVSVYRERGEDASPFSRHEIAELVHLDPRPWLLASNDGDTLTAELDFAEGMPARLELDAGARHPGLGSGLQMRLSIPLEPDTAIAQRLNAAEAAEPDAHQLGAWCVDDTQGVAFTLFLPSAAYLPGLARAMVYHLSARNEWTKALLFPG